MKCPTCGGAELVSALRDIPYNYKGHETVIKNVNGEHCSVCDEFLVGGEDGKRLSDGMLALNREVNMRAGLPQKVARARKTLGLTQQEASAIFGGGVNAFSRYERGVATPSVALVKLLDLLERHPELLSEVRESKVTDVYEEHCSAQ